jgi:hypothetical protein
VAVRPWLAKKQKGRLFSRPFVLHNSLNAGAVLISGQRCSQQRLASLRQKAAC